MTKTYFMARGRMLRITYPSQAVDVPADRHLMHRLRICIAGGGSGQYPAAHDREDQANAHPETEMRDTSQHGQSHTPAVWPSAIRSPGYYREIARSTGEFIATQQVSQSC